MPHRTQVRCLLAHRMVGNWAVSVAVFILGFIAALVLLLALLPANRAAAEEPRAAAPPKLSPVEAAREIDRLLARELFTQPVAADVDRVAADLPNGPVALAPKIDDATFLRRAMLDLTGATPTATRVLAFVRNKNRNKRAELIEELLATNDYARNWALYWRDVILYRRLDERSLLTLGVMTQYLTEQLEANRPWDELAREFITAKGDVLENGAAGLIMAQMGQPEETVAEISRIFLGIQIQCAQCHNHPYDRWKREEFHELAAFFPRVAVRPDNSGARRTFIISANDGRLPRRPNANARLRGTPEHYMEDLEKPEARGTLMKPIFFLTKAELPLGSRDEERRAKLADWITSPDNPWFARALVNRLWFELVGEGFYMPIDDIGPDRKPQAPETLEYIAASFAQNGHDIQWLMETIMLTQAYQREARAPRLENQTAFAANCGHRLRGDQLFNALTQTLGVSERMGRGVLAAAARGGQRFQFNTIMGFDPSAPRDEIDVAIPQALLMMNGNEINRAISATRGAMLAQILREYADNKEALEMLYLRVLSRKPSREETARCMTYIRQVGNRNEAFEDLLWVLINSSEFVHRP